MTEEQKSGSEEKQSFIKHCGIWIPPSTLPPLPRLLRWTIPGFVGRIVPQSLRRKTSWDYLQLLIVPLFLAIGAFILQDQADQRQQKIADNRTRQETLNKYLDNMTALLFEQKLRAAKPGSEAWTVARARTLTALRELDGGRKGQLLRFLQEADLITKDNPVIYLGSTTLSNTRLIDANLHGADLSGAILSFVDLSDVDLTGAILSNADLRGADLLGANLSSANLPGADLLIANLRGADLSGTNLKDALFCKTKMPDGTENNQDCPQKRLP